MPFVSGWLRSTLSHHCWEATLGRQHITSPLTQFGCYQTPSNTTSTKLRTPSWHPRYSTIQLRVKQHATEIKEMLEDSIWEAIQVFFLRGCIGSCIHYVGVKGNLDPWLAQFSMHAMDFQSCVLARMEEFYDLPMDLQTAAILQQLDMFLAMACMLPVTCPLLYPVPMPRSQAMLPPTPGNEAGKGRGTKPNTKSSTGTVCSSSTEPSKPRKLAPTPTSKATAAFCHEGEVSGLTASGHHDTASSTTHA